MSTQFDGIAEFVAVAQLGSFTAAAEKLGVTKSAVGRRCHGSKLGSQ
jgi:DNA-binding transcriptional LysR family regulator